LGAASGGAGGGLAGFGAAQRPKPAAAPAPGGAVDCKVGDKVSHGKWGVGTVVAVKGSGDDTELQIAFPAPTGVKRLLAKFAPLTKV
jgi:DNA helicase-2/ATP-dependent DNA helicase PcrA